MHDDSVFIAFSRVRSRYEWEVKTSYKIKDKTFGEKETKTSVRDASERK
jgi:hypothetical protein